MQIKIQKTIEEFKEIQFPYYTKSENGVLYAHYSENECVMVTPFLITILTTQNGYEHPAINEHEFEKGFSNVMTKILIMTNHPL